MQTQWGEIELWDAHAHLFSHRFFETLKAQKGSDEPVERMVEDLGWECPPADNAELAKRWIEELDRYGVERTVLMSSIPGDEPSAAEVVHAAPQRFIGYFMLNPLASNAAEHAWKAFDKMGLKGLCLFPAMHGFSVRDERLRSIYNLAAEREGTLVFVHMGVLSVGVRKKLGLPSKFDLSLSNPLDLYGVALEYPGVNFVMPHFGAGMFREALMVADTCPNVYLDTSSSNSWTKYLLPEVTLVDVFSKALQVLGPERLLFGSDSSFFPRGWNREVFDRQAQALETIGVDAAAAKAIFGGNLKRLLGEGG